MGDIKWKINTSQNKYIGDDLGSEEDNKEWKENFYFVIGADPQFGFLHMKESMQYPSLNRPCSWEEEIKLAEAAVEKINKLTPKPRFFVICGDLTNEFPDKNQKIKVEQIADFKRVFGKVDPDIPLVCVCGNHDIGDVANADSISRYRSDFGDDYYTFWCGGVFFIVYNSQYYKETLEIADLAEKHDKWLNEQLTTAAANASRIVCLSHIPWFNQHFEEWDSIYNIGIFTRKTMLEKLQDAGVGYMFFGHRHVNEWSQYKSMELVTTTSMSCDLGNNGIPGMIRGLGTGVPGLRIALVRQKDVIHRFYPYDEFPTSVDLKNGLL